MMRAYPSRHDLTAKHTATSSSEDRLARFRRYRATRDPELRQALVNDYLDIVFKVVPRFRNSGEPLEDIIQEGSIGLMKAVDYFDPDRGVQFATYASHLISSQILHYLRDNGHLIRQPAWVQELNAKITRVGLELEQELERTPTAAEIAARLDLTEEAVTEVLTARELNRVVSLTAPPEGRDPEELIWVDKAKIRSASHHTLKLPIEDRIWIEESFSKLLRLERQIVQLFFYEDLNLSEIARKLGISPRRSSYLFHRSVNKIKAELETQEVNETARQTHVPTSEMVPSYTGPTYDRLTGVLASPCFHQRLQVEITRAEASQESFVLLLAGIQEASETLTPNITVLANFLRGLLPTYPHIAYLGAQRFAVIVPDQATAECMVGDIYAHLLQQNTGTTHMKALQSCIFGCACYPEHGHTADLLLAQAELALAQSSKKGAWTVTMQPKRQRRGLSATNHKKNTSVSKMKAGGYGITL